MKERANAFSAKIMGFKCHPSKKIIVFIIQKLSNLSKLSKMQLVYTTCTKLCFLCPLSASIVCNNNCAFVPLMYHNVIWLFLTPLCHSGV